MKEETHFVVSQSVKGGLDQCLLRLKEYMKAHYEGIYEGKVSSVLKRPMDNVTCSLL